VNSSGLRQLLDRAPGTLCIVGLMSGTSVDGIDAALVEIACVEGVFSWRLLAFECLPWPSDLREAILTAFQQEISLPLLAALDSRLGYAFADAAIHLVESAGYKMNTIDAIASHGQTVWHQPDPVAVGAGWGRGTLQLGDGNVIAARTGCVVVSDFRRADMALGGQGAPLVPFVDYALFADRSEGRLVVNLGGIANMTWLRTGGARSEVRAFDTGPANMVLDAVTAHLTGGREAFDRDGGRAGRGKVDRNLLDRLLAHPYFALPPPKSTGREEFGSEYAAALIALAEADGISADDTLATAAELTVETIARAYETWIQPHEPVRTVILGGGGVHNATLVRRLGERLSPATLTSHAAFGLPDDAKEAFAFAMLAYETLNGRPGNMPEATGATGPAILGKIALPPPIAGN
jgi:anhydro-N-acetylmuramic acid kinase